MVHEKKGLTFDDFSVGDKLVGGSRTITQADIVNFAGISGDFNPLHTDETFAQGVHGGVIAHGALTFSATTGLLNTTGFFDGTCIAFLGLTLDYVQVVRPGDTIHLDATVLAKKRSSKGDRGVVTFDIKTMNQHGEAVLVGQWKLLMGGA